MKAYHCLIGEDGSWTDPVTNVLSVADFGRTELVSALFGGVLSTDSILPFLHEMTHHWCFRSPVGTAMAELHDSYELLVDEHRGEAVPEEALALRFRFLLALETLRPITEGLALFSEFDVMPPRQHAIASEPLRWASALYVRSNRPTTADIAEAILSTRLYRNTVRRKLDLLMQDLSWSSAGYLPGYLLIHDIYRGLAQRSIHLLEPDTFLNFAVTHFYSSEDLQSLLAERDMRFDHWTDAWARAWESLLSDAIEKIDNERVLDSMSFSPSTADTCATPLGEREVASLAEIRVEVKPSAGCKIAILLDGEEIVRGRPRVWPKSANPLGSLELWLVPRFGSAGIVVFHDDLVIFSRQAGGGEWTDLEPVFSRCRSRSERIDFRSRAAKKLTAAFQADPRTPEYGRALKCALEHITAIQANALFASIPDSVGKRLGETMVDGNFLSFFDGNIKRAEDYARLSLVSHALHHSRAAIRKLPSDLLSVINRAVQDALQLEDQTGVPFVIQDRDQLYCLL